MPKVVVTSAACLIVGTASLALSASVAPPEAKPAAAAPVVEAGAKTGFKQEVDGCTFVIDLVPFEVVGEVAGEGGAKKTLFVSTTEIPWELFDVFVYGSDKAEGKSNEKADAVTKPTKP